MTVPWYRQAVKGRKGQLMLQTGVGVSITLGFVVIPIWVEYLSARKTRKFNGFSTNTNIKQLVFAKRMEVRQKLLSGDK